MSLELPLDKHRNLQKLVRDAAAAQLDAALTLLHRPLKDAHAQDEAVHDVRKRLKEVRALLRLVREGLGKKLFDTVNTTLRDAGRPLSEVRDASAIIDALDKLPGPKAAVHDRLLARRTELRRTVIDDNLALQSAEKAIALLRKDCPHWKISGDWRILAAGIEAGYRKGRKAMHHALRNAADDAWHEWRKRVKDLRYQLEMLSPLWPRVVAAAAKEAHALTDLLGDDHDLAVLLALAPELKHAIDQRRKNLRADAAELGARVFAEKTKAFVKRIHAYWQMPEHADGESAAKGD